MKGISKLAVPPKILILSAQHGSWKKIRILSEHLRQRDNNCSTAAQNIKLYWFRYVVANEVTTLQQNRMINSGGVVYNVLLFQNKSLQIVLVHQC